MIPPDPSRAIRAIAAILLLLIAQTMNGQDPFDCTLSGRVVDETTGEPLENVNVFFAQTLLGTSTDARGIFRIAKIPRGKYKLVASRVGYQVQMLSVTVGDSRSLVRDIGMSPRLLQGEEVQVSGEAQAEWKRHFLEFNEKFLGSGDNASLCTILNPEVLSFHVDSISRDLVAISDDLVRVENRALGYRVEIVLSKFSWDLRRDLGQYLIYPRFEPLPSQQIDSLSFWEENRKQSYEESLQRFLVSLLDGAFEQDGYRVNIGTLSFLRGGSRRTIEPGDIAVEQTELWGMKRISFKDWLMVERTGERGRSTNYISLDQGAVLADSLGNLYDPLSVQMVGPWAERRVADMLPLFWSRRPAGTR
jgi:hypothetical protein